MKEIKCTDCGESNYIKSGFNVSRAGRTQRYLCKECGCIFTAGDE